MPELIVRKWDLPTYYMIFYEYGLYKARRGDNAEVQFKDPDKAVVFQNAINVLEAAGGGTIYSKVEVPYDSITYSEKIFIIEDYQGSIGSPFQFPYSCVVHKPDPDVEYYEAYKNIGRKYTCIKRYDLATPVVQQAANVLTDGGAISLKAGVYDFTDTVSLPAKVFVEGEGADATRIKAAADNVVLFKPQGRYWGIRRVYLDGQKSVYTGTGAIQGKPGDSEDGWIEDCVIKYFGSHAVYLQALRQHVYRCDIAEGDGDGIRMNYAGDSFIVGNLISSGLNGITLDFTGTSVIMANFIHDIGLDAINGYNGPSRNSIIVNRFWVIGRMAIWIRNAGGIYIGNGNSIIGNEFMDVDHDLNGVEAIRLQDVEETLVALNQFRGTNPVADVQEWGTANNNVIVNNKIVNGIVKLGANTVVRDNPGYATENSGSATIPNGSSSVTVNHGLAGTPTVVWIEVTHSELADYTIINKTSTQFTVQLPSNVTADRTFTWYAIYVP